MAWRGAAVGLVILALSTAYIFATLPGIDDVTDARLNGSVTLLDRDGEVFARRGSQFGGSVEAGNVSPSLVEAIVATEDRRFYWHPGIDPIGIATAMRINMREGRGPLQGHGGSTITQQVAKLMCLGVAYDADTWDSEAAYEADCRRTTLWRKVQEVPWSLALTLRYGREGVLSIYLNRAYFGGGAYGVAAAMERYFGATAAEATPQQSAMLAGLLTAPSRFAPTNDLQRSQDRASTVLGLMQRAGYLSQAEVDAARADPATLSRAARTERGGFFADWLMAEGPDFLTGDTTEDVILETTFDPIVQEAAEAAIEEIFATRISQESGAQAAIVILSPDGAVRGMVGGRDTRAVGLLNRASQSQRQPGSSFKPFVYAAALDQGWRFDDLIFDGELVIQMPGNAPYRPANYTREFYGEVTLERALRDSLNTAAVRLSETVGRDEVQRVARGFGIESALFDGPALALGVSEVSVLEMAGAYAGILNQGQAVAPYGVRALRLEGDAGAMFEGGASEGEQVISAQAAGQLTYIMNQVVTAGTGARAAFPGWEIAGKTGTSNQAHDAWFVGFTADYIAAVWMGYDQPTPLQGVTGGGLPAEIFRLAMEPIHADLVPRPLPMIEPGAMPRAVPNPNGPRPGGLRPAPGAPPIQSGVNEILDLIFGPSQ
ncbi:MAG: transglycosylase domain-containing protein [Pseudomonadota bacterium]